MEAMTITEAILSVENQKILNTPIALYEYIQKLYGVGSPKEDTYKTIRFASLGIPASPFPNTSYIMYIEPGSEPYMKSLVFGVNWPTEKVCFSRIIEVDATICTHLNNEPYAQCDYVIAYPRQRFEKEAKISFEVVAEFIRIMNEFLKQY